MGVRPAGLEKATGLISSNYLKDPTDPQWANEPDVIEWSKWMDEYNPRGNKGEVFNAYAYAVAVINMGDSTIPILIAIVLPMLLRLPEATRPNRLAWPTSLAPPMNGCQECGGATSPGTPDRS